MPRDQIALFLGLFLVVASLLSGVAALEYEFYLDTKVSDDTDLSEKDISEWVRYEELSTNSQNYVDRAIQGERLLFPARGDVPGFREPTSGNLGVTYDENRYIFHRGVTFVWSSIPGIVALLLLVCSIILIIQSVRLEKSM